MTANIFGPDLKIGIVVSDHLLVVIFGSQLPKIARNVGMAGKEFRKAQQEAEEEWLERDRAKAASAAATASDWSGRPTTGGGGGISHAVEVRAGCAPAGQGGAGPPRGRLQHLAAAPSRYLAAPTSTVPTPPATGPTGPLGRRKLTLGRGRPHRQRNWRRRTLRRKVVSDPSPVYASALASDAPALTFGRPAPHSVLDPVVQRRTREHGCLHRAVWRRYRRATSTPNPVAGEEGLGRQLPALALQPSTVVSNYNLRRSVCW